VERDSLFVARVIERKFRCVQERTLQTEFRAALSIDRVPDQRMIDRSQVYSNLMRAACLETTFQSGDNGWLRVGTNDSVVGSRVLAMGDHRHL
jgi:hypothetical protein